MSLKNFISKLLLVGLMVLNTSPANAKLPPPVPTTEFDRMAYAPTYPTYSWEVLPNTEFYQIQIFKDGKLFHELKNEEALYKMTDTQPFTEVGEYYWQVRAVDKKNNPLSDWSAKSYFNVTAPVKYAVLGDSISHGGAAFIPAGQLSCQWQTYCDVKIKNIARSGDTTAQMIERFEPEVLPFKPNYLIIMGGINDIRIGATADDVIKNFEHLQKMCSENNIVSIFVTLTPMNEQIIRSRGIFLTDKDWRGERKKINDWIVKTDHFVEINDELCDESGELKKNLTPDGLHPNTLGKISIGKTINNYLMTKFEKSE